MADQPVDSNLDFSDTAQIKRGTILEGISAVRGAIKSLLRFPVMAAARTWDFADRSGTIVTMPTDFVAAANAGRALRVNQTGDDIDLAPPDNAKTNAIAAAQTAAGADVGLVRSTGSNTADLLPAGAMAGPLLAAGDAAAVRGIAGLGTMAVQNADAVNITGGVAQGLTIAESDLFLNDSGIAIMRMTGDFYGGCELRLENRDASNGAVFRNLNIPLVDFRFEAAGAVQTIQMRSEFRPSLTWDGSAAEVEFFINGDAINSRICSFGGNRVNAYKPFSAPSISINNAPAITWHNSAIVPANGAVQDYTLTGLALNDFCQCSTGKPAQAVDIGGGVIRLRTDTTGFTGNVKIFAIRTN